MSADIIVAEALTVGYDSTAVIRAIDLRVGAGEVVALVGTNGSGKSTLLKTLVGLLPPLGGQLLVLGGRPGARPADIAYLSQFRTSGFVLPLRVRDVVRMGRFANHGLLGRFTPADAALVDQAIDRMGITNLAHRPLSELSGGQQQRAYLAQVLARRADLLVLDEPTAGIDAAGRELYEEVVAVERRRGAALVVATHDIGEAERADQVMLLAGRVVAQGPPGRVLSADNLLDAFGIGLRRVDGALLAGEQPHAHEEHESEGYHAGRVGHRLDEHGH
jgi:ABC-type Mn2+/Zn2+ transport system ATPase subunit